MAAEAQAAVEAYADYQDEVATAKESRNVAHLIPGRTIEDGPLDVEGEAGSLLFIGYPFANCHEELKEIATSKGAVRLTYLGPDLDTSCGVYRWEWADDKPEGAEE